MTDTPISERRFTDREVHDILKRAVEEASPRALSKGEGLSLAELKSIGQEVGIDPNRLELAARSVALDGGDRVGGILGGPLVLHAEQRVDGEYEKDDTSEILSRIRKIMGRQGGVDEVHGALEWSSTGEFGARHVSISTKDGVTTIRGSVNLSSLALAMYLPAGVIGTFLSGLGFFVAANNGNPIPMVLSLLLVPAMFAVMRTIFGKLSRSESAKIHRVVSELVPLIEGTED